MENFQFTDSLTPEVYRALREAVGWAPITPGQAERGLAHTAFVVGAKQDGRFVGMGRVLFDFGYTAYIGDIIVAPECQGKGLGREIVTRLMDRVKLAAEPGERIMFVLVAAKGKEGFYRKLGFQERPNAAYGPGMTQYFLAE